MKILIIGGTGLISTAITHQLLARGDDVTLYNRGKTSTSTSLDVRQITGDRRDFAAFESQMAAAGSFDCVIDMVCFQPEEAESAIRAFKGRVGHYLLCSTVDVYTKPAPHYPIREDAPQLPLGAYAMGKMLCESMCLSADRRGDMPVTILRPAQTYGEGGRLVHTFGWSTTYLDRIRRGKPIVIHGDGSSLWCACHIHDVARGFVNAAGNEAAFGKCYNVTGEEWMTWNQYAAYIAVAMGAPPPTIVHIPTDMLMKIAPKRAGVCAINFQFDNIFDNHAAHADLAFRYTIPFVEGVRRTIAWLDANDGFADSDAEPFDDRLIQAWESLGAQLAQALADVPDRAPWE